MWIIARVHSVTTITILAAFQPPSRRDSRPSEGTASRAAASLSMSVSTLKVRPCCRAYYVRIGPADRGRDRKRTVEVTQRRVVRHFLSHAATVTGNFKLSSNLVLRKRIFSGARSQAGQDLST